MTRKDWNIIAKALFDVRGVSFCHPATINEMIVAVADGMLNDDPKFERDEFIRLCVRGPDK